VKKHLLAPPNVAIDAVVDMKNISMLFLKNMSKNRQISSLPLV
jgi:hypothetical protein